MLKGLKLEKYRNYKKLELKFGQRTLFYGDNAQGKTNILEAIYFLSTLKSFRSSEKYLVLEEEDFFSVEGNMDDTTLRVVIQKINSDIKKTAQKKGKKVTASEFLKSFSAVLFAPEDVELISASPSARRRYLDIILSKTEREYLLNLSNYRRALLQRNALLKNIKIKKSNEKDIDIWDEEVIKYGNFIIEKRKEFLKKINSKIDKNYQKVSGSNNTLQIDYITKSESKEDLKKNILLFRQQDIRFGVTSVGPHRDDIAFVKNGADVSHFASRGDFRTIILALKLCEGEYFEETFGKTVTYLLDDVFSELDKSRRSALLSAIIDKQVVMTTTDLDHISGEFFNEIDIYEVVGTEPKIIKRD